MKQQESIRLLSFLLLVHFRSSRPITGESRQSSITLALLSLILSGDPKTHDLHSISCLAYRLMECCAKTLRQVLEVD